VHRMPKSPDAGARDRVAISNRRARHEYFILDTYECGLVLVGSEVTSIRAGPAHLSDAYARIDHAEVWLYGMHISPYPFTRDNPDPERKRKLLLHRSEIDRLVGKLTEAGLTMVPLKVFFQNGKAKIELGVARGKRQWDKRQAMAERDAKRDTDRAIRQHNRGSE